MATQVLIAHTGQRLEVDTADFSLLDDLKSWISRNASIAPQHIVALTPQGRSVKSASLHSEREIYVYDIRLSQNNPPGGLASLISKVPAPKRYSVPNAPNSIDQVQEIESWQQLYKQRRSWAIELAEDTRRMDAAAQARYSEIDVMIKCLDAAVANLEISVKQIEPKYNELRKWVKPALAEHEQLASGWETYLELARSLPAVPAMVKFMTKEDVDKKECTLADLIQLDTARKAGNLATTAHRRFGDKAAELEKSNGDMYSGLQDLIAAFDQLMARSVLGRSEETTQLQQDIEAVVNQIDSDYHTALNYGRTQRDIAQASKTASNHTERLVPALKRRAKEMDEMVQATTQARNTIAADLTGFMKAITEVTTKHADVKNQIQGLNQSESDMTTFDYLRLIHQVPYVYASFLVEAIRRREWVDKVKTDSSTLANEMALFQDEESKRRNKWHRLVGSMYGPSNESNVVGLEVNLLGDDTPWPAVGKDVLDSFVEALQTAQADASITEDIMKLVQELNAPTKQQTKRLKAFKNGSVHEAALGRSGLLLRGDDDLLRFLQDDKSRLESKLKTAESRIRRLEDLLHRESQSIRSGNLFQPSRGHERNTSSSSAISRNDDALQRRVAQLETELREEKKRSSRLEGDLNNRTGQHDDMKEQIAEANSTKKDLLENMEALKREFVDERKSFEEEIRTLKARLEDTEDEIEHFGESREHEKATYDEKVHGLESEIERLTKDRKDETLKAQGQVDFLRKETRMQREQIESSGRQLQSVQAELRASSKKLQDVEETLDNQAQVLKKLHVDLAPDHPVPDDPMDLADSVVSRAVDLLSRLQNTTSDASLVRTDLEQALVTAKDLRTELSEAQEKVAAGEESSMRLRENVSEEKARVSALEAEVAESREQLRQLRGRLSDGETGSETLQKKLEDEETKTAKLTEEVASKQSHLGSVEEELRMLREKLESLQGRSSTLTTNYEARDGRTKDLSQKLYSQNDRLIRLLDRLGYSVTRENGDMAITKIPRSERTTQNPNDSSDPGTSIRRSITLGGRSAHDSADLELLYWMNSTDASAEAEKYEAFVKGLGYFDADLFAETIYLRIKEAEHKARKWQREARTYRDRAHTLQRDAHDKIAFKNFKEGDLALFLPTRNQQAGAWAAFNVGFPHFFLREQDAHRLRHREWLVARISKVQERVVDLSKTLQSDSDPVDEDENPFQLSDGLRWYLIDAHEDKPGAPSTPGMGKSTVAANNVEATANIHTHKVKGKSRDSVTSIEGINKTLSKSLESRRSSTGSKKALPFPVKSALASETNSLRAVADSPAGTSPREGNGVERARSSDARSNDSNADGKSHDAGSNGPKGAGNDNGENQAGERSEARQVQREASGSGSPKKSVVWDSLWSVDYSYEGSGSK